MSENKTTAAADPHAGGKEMITDVFVRGARQGWGIAIGSMIPNVLMAFVIIKALQITGLLKIIGVACGPLMAVFGLPGESATVLLAAWMSMGGGVGVAIALFGQGLIDGTHLAVLTPAIYLMGSQLQYMGRLLGVVGISGKMIPVMMLLSILAAAVAMIIMRLFVL